PRLQGRLRRRLHGSRRASRYRLWFRECGRCAAHDACRHRVAHRRGRIRRRRRGSPSGAASGDGLIIDMHCHAYPRRSAEIVNQRLAHHGLAVPVIPAFDADAYVATLDVAGIDMAVLSLPGPSPDSLPTPADRLRFAREVNDLYAMAVARHPGRFRAFGRVPLVDGEAAALELRRIVVELDMNGVTLPTNVLDRPLDDPQFDAFWAEADRLHATCFLHPLNFSCSPMLQAYDLLTRIGWPADTTLAVGRLVLSGHRDRFPNVTLLISHLGGMIPTYLGRLSWATGAPKCARDPEHYYRSFYYDTAGEVR